VDDYRIFRRDGAAEGQLLRFRHNSSLRGPPDPAAIRARSSNELSVAELFGTLWLELADILGTAAAATLLRRAAQRAASRWPELAELEITRESLEYQYTLPSSWHDAGSAPPGALAALACELWPLLVDLTGTVVVQRLSQLAGLRERGIIPLAEAPR
jgi:hypothetical protein